MLRTLALACFAALTAFPQDFNLLVSFDNHNGAKPNIGLIQGLDGNYYGTTEGGNGFTGGWGYGTIYQLTPGGTVTNLHRFTPADPHGAVPLAGLAQDINGDFYGTTCASYCDGVTGYGTIFRMAPNGRITTLHAFDPTDGAVPNSLLVRGIDGSFYGTTSEGGADNAGTIFRITPDGTFSSLYSFTGASDGGGPEGLTLGPDGDFYGTTYYGGASAEAGTVFKIAPGGEFTSLYHFNKTSGTGTYSALTLGRDGDLYGMTYIGGQGGFGTIFKITPRGALTILHSFNGSNGSFPVGALVAGSDGNLYGTTLEGAIGYGNIFRITPGGVFTSLFTFSEPNQQGDQPHGGMLQGTDGDFYGTTWYGGVDNMGVVFRLSAGIKPFVKALPHLARAGDPVEILGNNLTGATGVSFNGTPAAFTIASPSLISAIVPAGATSGDIHVALPGGTLSSAGPFYVLAAQ